MLLYVDQIRMPKERNGGAPIPGVHLKIFTLLRNKDKGHTIPLELYTETVYNGVYMLTFFRRYAARSVCRENPRLAPWAVFFRRCTVCTEKDGFHAF